MRMISQTVGSAFIESAPHYRDLQSTYIHLMRVTPSSDNVVFSKDLVNIHNKPYLVAVFAKTEMAALECTEDEILYGELPLSKIAGLSKIELIQKSPMWDDFWENAREYTPGGPLLLIEKE